MQHPKFIQRIHRFLNPSRHSELRQLEQYRRDREVKADEYERRKAELEWPNGTTYAHIYWLGAIAVLLAVVVTWLLCVGR